MTAVKWEVFDVFLAQLGNELHDLNATDTIKMALIDSGWTPNTATDVTFSVVAGDELTTANGYTAGGATTVMSWTTSAGTLKCDVVDTAWTASGGAITARYALLYNSSAGGANDLIAYSLLDDTPADVTAADGIQFRINIHASGAFTIS